MTQERESPFTGAGQILFLVTIILGFGGIAAVLLELVPSLPSGSYPLFYLLGPVFIAAAFFFFGVAAILRKRGIPVLVSERAEIERLKKERETNKNTTK